MLFHHRHDRSDDALDELALRFTGAGSEGSPEVRVATEGAMIEL